MLNLDLCFSGLLFALVLFGLLFLFSALVVVALLLRQKDTLGIVQIAATQSVVLYMLALLFYQGLNVSLSPVSCETKATYEGLILGIYLLLVLVNIARVAGHFISTGEKAKRIYSWISFGLLICGHGYFWLVIFPSF